MPLTLLGNGWLPNSYLRDYVTVSRSKIPQSAAMLAGCSGLCGKCPKFQISTNALELHQIASLKLSNLTTPNGLVKSNQVARASATVQSIHNFPASALVNATYILNYNPLTYLKSSRYLRASRWFSWQRFINC
jgi:hypothetical protein